MDIISEINLINIDKFVAYVSRYLPYIREIPKRKSWAVH